MENTGRPRQIIQREVVERIQLQQGYSRVGIGEQGAQSISAIAADYNARRTSASVSENSSNHSSRISAMPIGSSAYQSSSLSRTFEVARTSDTARASPPRAAAPAYTAAGYQAVKTSSDNAHGHLRTSSVRRVYTSEEYANLERPSSSILGVYSAEEYSQLERERQKAKIAASSLPYQQTSQDKETPRSSSGAGAHTSSREREKELESRKFTGSLLAKPGLGVGHKDSSLTSSGKANAYRDLDAVINDIRKVKTLNKEEEFKTQRFLEELERKRKAAQEADAKGRMNTTAPLDDLGIQNANLLSRLGAAMASVSDTSRNATSRNAHSSAASTKAVGLPMHASSHESPLPLHAPSHEPPEEVIMLSGHAGSTLSISESASEKVIAQRSTIGTYDASLQPGTSTSQKSPKRDVVPQAPKRDVSPPPARDSNAGGNFGKLPRHADTGDRKMDRAGDRPPRSGDEQEEKNDSVKIQRAMQPKVTRAAKPTAVESDKTPTRSSSDIPPEKRDHEGGYSIPNNSNANTQATNTQNNTPTMNRNGDMDIPPPMRPWIRPGEQNKSSRTDINNPLNTATSVSKVGSAEAAELPPGLFLQLMCCAVY